MYWVYLKEPLLPPKLTKSHFYSWPQPVILNTYQAYELIIVQKFSWYWYEDLMEDNMEININCSTHHKTPFFRQKYYEVRYYSRLYIPQDHEKIFSLLEQKHFYQKRVYQRLYKHYMFYEDIFIDDLFFNELLFSRLYHNHKLLFDKWWYLRRLFYQKLLFEVFYFEELYFKIIRDEDLISRRRPYNELHKSRLDRYWFICRYIHYISHPKTTKWDIYRLLNRYMNRF